MRETCGGLDQLLFSVKIQRHSFRKVFLRFRRNRYLAVAASTSRARLRAETPLKSIAAR
jgi:hypothetical protein